MARQYDTGGPFAIVPLWLFEALPATDRRLCIATWVALWRYADRNDLEAFPSRLTLADDVGVSVDLIDRGIKRLVSVGAIHKYGRATQEGRQTANLYRLRIQPPEVIHRGGRKIGTPGAAKSAPPGAAKSGHELEPNELDPLPPSENDTDPCAQPSPAGSDYDRDAARKAKDALMADYRKKHPK